MAITKKYQLLKSMSILAWFKVGDKTVSAAFQGGTRRPYLVRGRFSTSDPELQKAIESSGNFGKEYFLEATFNDGILIEPQNEKPIEKPKKKENEVEEMVEITPAEKTKKEDTNQTIDYPEIKTVKDAREKLLELYPDELKPAQLPNKGAVLSKAKGKDITFSNLI